MKTCYMCHGELKRDIVQVRIDNVIVNDIIADVCQRCGEQYFDTKTSTFIQNVTRYIEEQKRACTLEAIKAASTIQT